MEQLEIIVPRRHLSGRMYFQVDVANNTNKFWWGKSMGKKGIARARDNSFSHHFINLLGVSPSHTLCKRIYGNSKAATSGQLRYVPFFKKNHTRQLVGHCSLQTCFPMVHDGTIVSAFDYNSTERYEGIRIRSEAWIILSNIVPLPSNVRYPAEKIVSNAIFDENQSSQRTQVSSQIRLTPDSIVLAHTKFQLSCNELSAAYSCHEEVTASRLTCVVARSTTASPCSNRLLYVCILRRSAATSYTRE